MKHLLEVHTKATGQRVDLFVGHHLSLSRLRLKTLFHAMQVRVDGHKVKKGFKVQAGQHVEIELQDKSIMASMLLLTVLHEDEAVVVVDKPSGIPSQPLKYTETGTIANALLARYPEVRQVGEDLRDAGLCHRLDIQTSGVLLAARNQSAWKTLRDAFSACMIEKHYLALITGSLPDTGQINVPLAHAGNHVRTVANGPGRIALTKFSVRARKNEYALVDVQPTTGVLHQVRAHLATIGAPIVGDVQYGGRREHGLNRFFLHAMSLEFRHPVNQKRLRVESQLPQSLQDVLNSKLYGL